MNYNVDELYKRMQAGESMDTIAQEITDALNAALMRHEAEEKRKEEEARLAATLNRKREWLEDLVCDVLAWVAEFYPDLVADLSAELSKEDKEMLMDITVSSLIEAMDKTVEQMKSPAALDPMTMMMMAKLLDCNTGTHTCKCNQDNKKSKTDDDILNDFLNKICH